MRKVLGFGLTVFLLLPMICCKESKTKHHDSYNMLETKLLKKVSQLKLGMSESQVVAIIGDPKSCEKEPFLKTGLPSNAPCDPQSQEYANLLLSVRRDHYEWQFNISEGATDHIYLDVYYDSLLKVCYLQDSSGMSWTLTEY